MGFGELLLILFLVVLFFGSRKLGGLGGALGKSLKSVKDAVSGDGDRAKPEARPKGELPPKS